MFAGLTGWHLLIILAVILLLFGATKLPALSKSVGQSMRIFKNEVKTMKEDEAKDTKDGKDADALSAEPQKRPQRNLRHSPSLNPMSTATRPKRGKDREGRMSLGQHLVELRKRLTLIAIGILLGAVAGWFLSPYIWDAMSAPVHAMAKAQHASINYPNITAAFDLKMQVSIYAGIVISSPLWLYQVFAFLVPGLTGKEKRYTFGFFFTAIPLFIAGCGAGWFVLPHIVTLLTSFSPKGDATLLSASDYFSFVLKLVVAIGVAFVLPVFLVLLNFMGILSARGILKAWRIALVVIMLFTAIATPSADVISMFMLAVPLVVLYFGAAGVAAIHDRRIAKTAVRIEAELGS